jgi:hypothetical protein
MRNKQQNRSGWARCLAVALLALGLVGSIAQAEEVIVKNDSVVDFGQAFILGDFIPGEHAAARLTSPCDGTIVAVQILWLEGSPGNPASLEEAIHIYADGSFPNPGPELALLEGPLMTPGYLNEFRYLDEAGQIPINIPISQGENFIVSLEFANATDVGGGSPSVVEDTDGCQSGRNMLYGRIGALWRWWDFCFVGISGDVVIRAVIECEVPPGACCDPDGQCIDDVESDYCDSIDGTFMGGGTLCSEVECPEPVGACCWPDGTCQNSVEQTTCEDGGGIFQGGGSLCSEVECPEPTGACCDGDAMCTDDLTFAECESADGMYMGNGTMCSEVECPEPLGACCLGGSCLSQVSELLCGQVGGTYIGNGSSCADDPCVPGACCHPDGSCSEDIEVDCLDMGGAFAGVGTDCMTYECPQPVGACCIGDVCIPGQTEEVCSQVGEWMGINVPCDPNPCVSACDDGDPDASGVVDLHDFWYFQNCFGLSGTGECECVDMDNNDVVDEEDYYLFAISLDQ